MLMRPKQYRLTIATLLMRKFIQCFWFREKVAIRSEPPGGGRFVHLKPHLSNEVPHFLIYILPISIAPAFFTYTINPPPNEGVSPACSRIRCADDLRPHRCFEDGALLRPPVDYGSARDGRSPHSHHLFTRTYPQTPHSAPDVHGGGQHHHLPVRLWPHRPSTQGTPIYMYPSVGATVPGSTSAPQPGGSHPKDICFCNTFKKKLIHYTK